MEPGDTQARFHTTDWSRLRRAQIDEAELEAVLAEYWSPAYAFFRRRGHQCSDAADLTQAFLTDVMLGRDLIGRASPECGRFRAFLLTALRNYEIDAIRGGRVSKSQQRRRLVPLEQAALDRVEPKHADEPDIAFNRQWAAVLMEQALERTREDCHRDGLETHWRVFERCIVGPATRNVTAPEHQDLANALGVARSTDIASMIYTVKRKCRKAFESCVAMTVDEPHLVSVEVAELDRHLGIGSGNSHSS